MIWMLSDFGFRIADFGFRISDCGFRIAEFGMCILNFWITGKPKRPAHKIKQFQTSHKHNTTHPKMHKLINFTNAKNKLAVIIEQPNDLKP
jgi:hypothetical protein